MLQQPLFGYQSTAYPVRTKVLVRHSARAHVSHLHVLQQCPRLRCILWNLHGVTILGILNPKLPTDRGCHATTVTLILVFVIRTKCINLFGLGGVILVRAVIDVAKIL